MRLKAIHLPTSAPPLVWSKVRVVFFPTLKVSQLSNACWVVCLMVT